MVVTVIFVREKVAIKPYSPLAGGIYLKIVRVAYGSILIINIIIKILLDILCKLFIIIFKT
jgi:hypothetical protein